MWSPGSMGWSWVVSLFLSVHHLSLFFSLSLQIPREYKFGCMKGSQCEPSVIHLKCWVLKWFYLLLRGGLVHKILLPRLKQKVKMCVSRLWVCVCGHPSAAWWQEGPDVPLLHYRWWWKKRKSVGGGGGESSLSFIQCFSHQTQLPPFTSPSPSPFCTFHFHFQRQNAN